MNKYRVKNCPAISFAGGCKNGEVKVWDCKDCTDCVLKQIVELCKETLEQENDPINSLEMSFAQKILKRIDIQEVE